MKSGNLNFLEPSGPLQACNGTEIGGKNYSNLRFVQNSALNKSVKFALSIGTTDNLFFPFWHDKWVYHTAPENFSVTLGNMMDRQKDGLPHRTAARKIDTYTSIAPPVSTIPTLQNTQHCTPVSTIPTLQNTQHCTPSQHNTHITEHPALHPKSAQYPHYRTHNIAPEVSTIPTLQNTKNCTPFSTIPT